MGGWVDSVCEAFNKFPQNESLIKSMLLLIIQFETPAFLY